jgi:type I restriction enzyme S subunit
MTDWPVKTLGDVCDVARGTSITRKETKEGAIPVVAGGIDVAYFHSVPNRPEGTITISSSGANAGFVNRWAIPIFASDCSTVVAKEGGAVLGDYAFRFLQFKQGFINTELRRGAAQPHVYAKDIAAIEIPVPPLEEQKRIVALLDAATSRVTELTACYEKARTHANNLFASALRDALESNPDWPVKTLGEVCSIDSVLVDPKDLKYSHMSHIGAGNIEAQTGRLFDIKTASEDNLISGKYLFTTNDVLYSKIRPYLVKVATPETAGLCSADVYPLRPGPLLTRMFLFYSLISETFTEYAIGGSSRTGMPKVNREHLFKYELRIPPTAVQLEIVSRLEAVRVKTSEMVAAYEAKLAAAKNLRQSILEAAFAGEL